MTVGANTVVDIDFGHYGTPPNNSGGNSSGGTLSVAKTASPASITLASGQPFTPVTYTYTVTNNSASTLYNIVVTDDNGTPADKSDDVTVGTIASLAPNSSTALTWTTYPPMNTVILDSKLGAIPGGMLKIQNTASPAGCTPNVNCYLKFTLNQALTLNDNSYGTNSSAAWTAAGKTHKFQDLTGSDQAEFLFFDSKGSLALDFKVDYISQASTPSAMCPNPNFTTYPSGYGTLGWCGGDGGWVSGDSSYVKGMDSTLTDDLNQSSAFYGYTTNSPAAGFPGWNFVDGYTVIIDPAAFGANGFGFVKVPLIHNSPSINGTDQVNNTPTNSVSTNTATATATGGLTATATASVTITSSISPASTGGSTPAPPQPGLNLPFPPGANGVVGTPFSVTLAATGGAWPYTYSVSAGALPAGLSLNPSTGVISGTPTKAASGPAANITFKVTDSQSPPATDTATGAINIAGPPPLNLPFPAGPAANGTVGTPYVFRLAATGGSAPYTYTVSTGTLPAGLSLNSSTGVISGTPTKAVSGPSANITLMVTDSESPAATKTATGAINIAAPPPLNLPFPAGPAANGTVGTPYSVTLAATGGIAPYAYSVSTGTLPAGLSLNSSTGVISGTPTKAVSGPAAAITFMVVDSESPSVSKTATGNINIAAPPALTLPFPAGPAANGTVGTPYSVTLAATGGIGPYTYTVSAGTLPAGLSLNSSTGVISGTPTKAVSGPAANITFMVTDSESPAATKTAAGAINITAAAPAPPAPPPAP